MLLPWSLDSNWCNLAIWTNILKGIGFTVIGHCIIAFSTWSRRAQIDQ
jgi:hypothetical protein